MIKKKKTHYCIIINKILLSKGKITSVNDKGVKLAMLVEFLKACGMEAGG